MNPHLRFLFSLSIGAWFGFVPLVSTTLMVCLLASATNVHAQQQGGWSVTGLLSSARYFGHTATLLANDKVLVVGGADVVNPCCRKSERAELYDPATGQWSVTGSLSTARVGHIAVRLANGKVLVVGGVIEAKLDIKEISAEIYDPDSGAWSPAGSLNLARVLHTATLLVDGRVLVTGGADDGGRDTAELYDPATDVWSPAGMMNSHRGAYTATLLLNGKVLVVGGVDPGPPPYDDRNPPHGALRSAELYDPATGSWTATGDLITAHVVHTATLLHNGKVLVAGGGRDQYPWEHVNGVDKAELYDPATGQWSSTGNLTEPRLVHTATLLHDGSVLVAGGLSDAHSSSAELYDPVTGSWSVAFSVNGAGESHTATLLANGKVLAAGGFPLGRNVEGGRNAELYDPGFEIPLLTLNSKNYCIGDPWRLAAIGSVRQASVHLMGVSNGAYWEIVRWGATDADGSFTTTGTIAGGTEGTHTLSVEISGIRSNAVSFAVLNCNP